jgi:saccharopine dehydrogenase (NADP+, L-glutamate forming)
MKSAADLGLFDADELDWPEGTTYADFLVRKVPEGNTSLAHRVAGFLGVSPDSEVIARLEWAGLFSDRPIRERRASPLEVFGNRLMRLMMYQPGERDMVVLKHVFTITYPDGAREERHYLLVLSGEPWGDSAMARTVSLPAAIATNLILENGTDAVGVRIPVLRDIYEPVLAELADLGIELKETRVKSFHSPFDA